MSAIIKKDITINLVGAITPTDIAIHYNLKWRTALVILLALTFEGKLRITKGGFVGVWYPYFLFIICP